MGRKRIRTLAGWTCSEGHETAVTGIKHHKRLTHKGPVVYYTCAQCLRDYQREYVARKRKELRG